MFDHRTPGFVAVAVSFTSRSDIQEISFYSERTGFGLLADATIYQTPPVPGDGVELVPTEEIGSRIIDLAQDRAGLSLVADFRSLTLGKDGVPFVYELTLFCRGCGYGWVEELSRKQEICECPRCQSSVEARRAAMLWTGPSLPILIEVWNALPDPGARSYVLGTGMRIFETGVGFILVDASGHRMTLASTYDGFKALVARRGHNGELEIDVNTAGITAEAPTGSVPQ